MESPAPSFKFFNYKEIENYYRKFGEIFEEKLNVELGNVYDDRMLNDEFVAILLEFESLFREKVDKKYPFTKNIVEIVDRRAYHLKELCGHMFILRFLPDNLEIPFQVRRVKDLELPLDRQKNLNDSDANFLPHLG